MAAKKFNQPISNLSGGMNTVAPASAIQNEQCVQILNMDYSKLGNTLAPRSGVISYGFSNLGGPITSLHPMQDGSKVIATVATPVTYYNGTSPYGSKMYMLDMQTKTVTEIGTNMRFLDARWKWVDFCGYAFGVSFAILDAASTVQTYTFVYVHSNGTVLGQLWGDGGSLVVSDNSFLTVYANRLFIGGWNEYEGGSDPSRARSLYFTDVAQQFLQTTHVVGGRTIGRDTDFIILDSGGLWDISTHDTGDGGFGERITALEASGLVMLIFTRGKIFTFGPTTASAIDDLFDYTIRQTDNVGCINGYLIKPWTQGTFVFPAYDGIYMIGEGTGLGDYKAKKISSYIKELNPFLDQDALGIRNIFSHNMPAAFIENDHYVITYTETLNVNGVGPRRAFACHLPTGRWTRYAGDMVGTAATEFKHIQSDKIGLPSTLIGTVDGEILYTDPQSLSDFNGAFTKRIITKSFDYDDKFSDKLFEWLKIHLTVLSDDLTVTVQVKMDEDPNRKYSFQCAFSATGSNGARWATAQWSTARWGGATSRSQYLQIIERVGGLAGDNTYTGEEAKSIQLTIETDGEDDNFYVHQVGFEGAILDNTSTPDTYVRTDI